MQAQQQFLEEDASPQTLSAAELGMLLKSIQAFVPEFPRLEMGDPVTRANRLLAWKISVQQAINPAGPHLIQWWKWCQKEADQAYKVFLKTAMHERKTIIPISTMPSAWMQVEAWIRPRILEALPKDIREWVIVQAR